MVLSFPGILLGFILLVKSHCPKSQTYFSLSWEWGYYGKMSLCGLEKLCLPSKSRRLTVNIDIFRRPFIWMRGCAAAAAKSLQSCATLCDPIDGSPPGSPVLGILQARVLEWVAISLSNAWKCKVKVKSLSRVRLFESP